MTQKRRAASPRTQKTPIDSHGQKPLSEIVPDPDAPVIRPAQFIKFFLWLRDEQIEKKLFSHKVATLIGGATHPSAGRGKPQMLSFKDAILMFVGAELNDLLQWPAHTRACITVLRPQLDAIIEIISWKKICAHFDTRPPQAEGWRFDWTPLFKPPVAILIGFKEDKSFMAKWHEIDPSFPFSFLTKGRPPETYSGATVIYEAKSTLTMYIDVLAHSLMYEEHEDILDLLRARAW